MRCSLCLFLVRGWISSIWEMFSEQYEDVLAVNPSTFLEMLRLRAASRWQHINGAFTRPVYSSGEWELWIPHKGRPRQWCLKSSTTLGFFASPQVQWQNRVRLCVGLKIGLLFWNELNNLASYVSLQKQLGQGRHSRWIYERGCCSCWPFLCLNI